MTAGPSRAHPRAAPQTGLLLAGRGAAPPPALVLLRRLETEEPPPVGEVGPAALLAELFES